MLNIFEAYGIHLFSIILLLIIYVINKLKRESKTFSMQLFYGILFTNILLLVLEPLSFLADYTGIMWIHYANYSLDFLIIMFSTIIVGLWASYIDYKLFKKQQRIYQRLFYQHITIVALVLLIINFFTPILFHVDVQTNIYERGYLFGIRYVLIIAVYIHVVYMVLKNKSRKNSKIVTGVLLFLLFPIIGSIVQVFYQRLYFQYSGLAMGLLVVFVFLETTSGNKDYLTNLYTRRVLDEYLDNLIVNKKEFTMVMIDIDNFKQINDTYGHQNGDEVLVEFSSLLLEAKMDKQSIVTRLGGDEFLCILLNEDHEYAQVYIKRIKILMSENMTLSSYPKLDFSYGAYPYDHKLSTDLLLRQVDQLMYEDKKLKR